jgi:outer membrane protein OmpA-like peptidoglycan-associated protein
MAEDKDGFQDNDGCLDLDNDGDGINDEVDDCPAKPEVINGTTDDDGCPDNGKQEIYLESGRFRFEDQITFARRGAILSPKGQNLVGQVARLLVRNPDILRVRIESHTDDPGSDSANLLLSQRRAESVRDALVALGVAEDRLEVFGHGRKKPLASSRTAAGRAKNERVEILIVERKEPGKAQGGRP